MESDAKSRPAIRRQDRIVVFSLWLMVFAASSQVMIIAPILPRVGVALQISEELQGTLITGYATALAIFALVIGPISDRYGRRAVLLLGTSSMMLALLCHGLAVDYWTLLGARVLAGCAGGLLTGSSVAYVGDYFPYERRGWANGWVMSGFAVGQVLAIPAGSVLADRLDFRAPFLVFAAAMAASFLMILITLPQPDVERSHDRLTVGSALRGYGTVLRNPTVAAGSIAYFLMFMHVSTFVTFLPTWLEEDIGATVNQVASMFLVGGIASVLFGPQAGRLSDRIGRKPMIVTACLAMGLLMVSCTFIVHAVWAAHVMFFVTMFLLAMRLTPFQTLLSSAVPSTQRGSTMSLIVAFGQVGSGIGGAIAGIIYPRWGFLGDSVISGALIFVVGLVVWAMIAEPEAHAGEAAP